METEVGLVRTASGFGHREVRHAIEDGYRGLVIEAMGRGNVPPEVAEAAGEAVGAGMVVCVCSRCCSISSCSIRRGRSSSSRRSL